MFAYCENNPVYYSDPSGMIRNTFLGDNHVLSDNILMSGGGGGITASSRISSSTVIANEIAFIHNDDPTVVLNAENIAFYRGAPVIKVKAMDDSAFSFGIILMGPNVTSPELVKHERGHVDQLVEIGMSNYAMLVVAPSLDCYWMSRFEILPSSLYHSLPWEYKANEYGQAHFPVFGWAQTASDVYWLFVQIMSGLL